MGNYSYNKREAYSLIRNKNLNKTSFICACCKKELPIKEAMLAYSHYGSRNGIQHVEVFAYRLCPDCMSNKKEKDKYKELKRDRILKYLGTSAIVWGAVLGLLFLLILLSGGGAADSLSLLLGFWIVLPLIVTILMVVGFVGSHLYSSIMSASKLENGIDFDEALSGNAVHWFVKD